MNMHGLRGLRKGSRFVAIAAILLAAASLPRAYGGAGTHRYAKGEDVDLWVNTVGPYHNPHETYSYYQLPFCKPESDKPSIRKRIGLGEVLEGHELRNSGYEISFLVEVEEKPLCSMTFSQETAKQMNDAVEQSYWYEMFLDDLPMWGMVGETKPAEMNEKKQNYIYTSRKLSIAYNDDRIIEVNLTSGNPESITPGQELIFKYSVTWLPTTKSYDSRFNRYLEHGFFEHQIHWFSIFNSFMMVVFLCGLVVLILLRTLKNDFARYSKDEDDLEGIHVIGEDSGWKQVHGDVFRAPDHLVLFSAMIGTGWQLGVLVLGVILFALLGPFHGEVHEERGEVTITVVISYALTSTIAGYASGSYYKQYFNTPRAEQHSNWQQVMILTILLYPTTIAICAFVLNTCAIYYDTSNALPFTAILKMLGLWLFVSLPLTIVGTLVGRHSSGRPNFPCRVNSIPRPIPVAPWYSSPMFVIPAAGLLPFGSIFIEMYFIFTSFWSYKFYYVYGFMLLVYCILMMVLVCTSIVATYFVLNAENYHWQWIAFSSSGFTSSYVFLYSLYYFFYRTEMTGFLQVSFYFGNMFVFCVGLFLLCGTIGVWGSTMFVRKIYQQVKID